MINKDNILNLLENYREILPIIRNRVSETKDRSLSFRYKPINSIKAYLSKKVHVLQFPSKSINYGSLITNRNNRYYIYINTGQPKVYENLRWVSGYYYYQYESEEIRNSDILSIFEETIENEKLYSANLFAIELLINSRLLLEQFNLINELYVDESLENRIVRLIPIFKLPFKQIVVKLALDGIILDREVVEIIDFRYKTSLPADFDQTILKSSMAIRISNLNSLLNNEVVKVNMLEADLRSFQTAYEQHITSLEILRERQKE